VVYSGAMRIFVTGGTGVLGRALLSLLRDAGHDLVAPTHVELDLLADPDPVRAAAAGTDAIYHLATRIPPRERWDDRAAWDENDRLRRDVSRLLVDAALAGDTQAYVQPTVAIAGWAPTVLESALAAEAETARFAASGRRGVVLRLGILDGPGTFRESPDPDARATLHVEDAGRALLAALDVPSGTYEVARGASVRFRSVSGWSPTR
jgi:nucleoside-diphosphate-sugar epimerase